MSQAQQEAMAEEMHGDPHLAKVLADNGLTEIPNGDDPHSQLQREMRENLICAAGSAPAGVQEETEE
jgi:hypothetical protein